MKRVLPYSFVTCLLVFLVFFLPSLVSASTNDRVVEIAKQYIGTPYKWGGTTPRGFDCSGFSQHVYAQVGITLPRTTDTQYRVGETVSRNELQPGDLVFFKNTYRSGLSHSGIYIGNYQFIHASSSKGISITSLSNSYWAPRWLGAKRIIEEPKKQEQPKEIKQPKQFYDVFNVNGGLLETLPSREEAISVAQEQEKSYVVSQNNNSTVWLSSVQSNTKNRIAGVDRIETSIQISNIGWPNGAETAIIASGNNFPDALSGAPLAYELDAPILLNSGSSLNGKIRDEIARLGASKVIILGGAQAVSGEVEKELAAMKLNIERIAGRDRYETSVKIAEQLQSVSDTFVLTSGGNFPDALSVASYAASNGYPILLTSSNQLPQATKDAVKSFTKGIVIGGEVAINNNVLSQLPNGERIAGTNRFDTVSKIYEKFGSDSNKAYVATGYNFADALSSSVLAAKEHAPVLLVTPDRMPEEVWFTIQENGLSDFTIIGGKLAVSESLIK
ncbi:cell wall-binding repeat-containing protein [Alkalihalobacillus sp. BA299]|uniref:cell wall-binding repeat-containing protein n=1 Tax=Alkalihalobacillus sp. BA299 TaxID=2815938 RepID=UPI001ADA1DAF|nr:cell wall-binding repeat-containing protein [Alkalihalobacillus sp. BA299]